MELLERYLHAVGMHLPAKGREDTLAELRANLLDGIEAREEAAGRPLTEAEVAAMLEQYGMPVTVAARYMPQHSLIGPELFPFYVYVLKRSFPLVALAYAAVVGVRMVFGGVPMTMLPNEVLHFAGVALTYWAVITLGFAAFEYVQYARLAKIEVPRWSVRDLPKVEPETKGFSVVNAVADLIVSVLMISLLLAVPSHPYLLIGPGARIVHGTPFGLTPEWHVSYWQIVGLLIAMLPLKTAMLFSGLRRWRPVLQIVVRAIGMLILVVIVQVRTFFVAAGQLTAENMRSLEGMNAAMTLAFKVVLAITAVKFVWDLWQLLRGGAERKVGVVAVL